MDHISELKAAGHGVRGDTVIVTFSNGQILSEAEAISLQHSISEQLALGQVQLGAMRALALAEGRVGINREPGERDQ